MRSARIGPEPEPTPEPDPEDAAEPVPGEDAEPGEESGEDDKPGRPSLAAMAAEKEKAAGLARMLPVAGDGEIQVAAFSSSV